MKKQKSSIIEAKKYFYAKKFSQVIRVLEPEIFQYRDNFIFYYMLGLSYIFLDDTGGSETYLKRALHLEEDNIEMLLSLAYVRFKRGQTDEALKIWLDILELEPGNRVARKGLNLLRKKSDPSEYYTIKNLKQLLPPVKFPFLWRIIFVPLIVILLSGGIVFSVYKFFPADPASDGRPEIERYTLSPKGLVEYAPAAAYTLSDDQVLDTFNRAKGFFNRYRDNLAMVEVNRLLNSNANPGVKQTAVLMKQHVEKPDFSTIKDSFELPQVLKEPFLYDGCFVAWRGKVGSLEITLQQISFQLWVGDSQHFEGVVPVTLYFGTNIENGQEVEVLGEIVSSGGEPLSLTGHMIHRIYQTE